MMDPTSVAGPVVELLTSPPFDLHGEEHREIWLHVLSPVLMTLAMALKLLPEEQVKWLLARSAGRWVDGVPMPEVCDWYSFPVEEQDQLRGHRYDEWWVFRINRKIKEEDE